MNKNSLQNIHSFDENCRERMMMNGVKATTRLIFGILTVLLIARCGGGGSGNGSSNGAPPIVEIPTPPATSITENSAILYGTVIPNNQPTDYQFQYGTESSLGSYRSTPSLAAGSGMASVTVNYALSGLESGKTYYFRLDAVNSVGEARSSIESFTTSSPSSPPAVTTLAATSVSSTSAALNGNVTPNGLETNDWFEWGTDSNFSSSSATGSQPAGSGTTSQLVTVPLTGLSTGTTYYYRVVASNSTGISRGAIVGFTPGAAPAVTTLAATSVSINSAVLNGNVTPNGLITVVGFEWGTDSNLGTSSLTPLQTGLSGTSPLSINRQLTGLAAGATYYYRVVASNSGGSSEGAIRSFLTLSSLSEFFDDFSADTTVRTDNVGSADPYTIDLYNTTGGYTVTVYASVTNWVPGENEGMVYKADLSSAQAHMSVNHGVVISHNVPASSQGLFSMDFYPVKKYGDGAGITFRLRQDADNYFEISNGVNDGWGGIPTVKKVVAGTIVDQRQYSDYYSQGGGGTNYPIRVTFSPTQTTWEAFGFKYDYTDPTTGGRSISVQTLELNFWQQDANIDNIRLQTTP